ncbi:MAG: sulfite exporter TauE/SafE family protein [Flavobacteriales bacterium]|jgi:uncharacterized membrane protein YfcA|nr:MAG: sulfite exporter TauE/SafE family protein [Flavobacteriales bacterium]
MDVEIGLFEIIVLALCGFGSGIINTIAGNGSALTLPALIFVGIPPSLANGTNRVGIFLQTLTSIISLRRTKRTRYLYKEASWVFIPSILGSIVGSYIALDIDDLLLKRIIGVLMILLLLSFLLNPKRWNIATDPGRPKKSLSGWLMFFVVGIYTGFIQMGVGIVMLALLVLVSRYSLKDANILKLILAFVLGATPFIFFALKANIHWGAGLSLASGQTLGAFIGARYVLYHPKAFVWSKRVLLAVLVFSILAMFDIIKL